MEKSRRVFFRSEEIVKKTKVGWVEIDMNFQQLYHNAWKFTSQLNGVCSRDFLLWIVGRLDENNIFVYNRSLYREFTEELRLITGGRIYEENTLHLALREFLEKGIAWKISRGIYQINPAIFNPMEIQESIPAALVAKQENVVLSRGDVNPPVFEEASISKTSVRIASPEENLEAPPQVGLFSFDSFVD